MGAMVTVFAPDGTQGQIPQSNVQAAVKAGGKVGVHIYAPDGTEGYVPQDRVADAMHSGATMEPKAPQQGFLSSLADSTGLSSAYNSAKQEVTSAVQHPVDTALDWMSGGPAQRAAQGVVQMGKDSAGQIKQAYQSARAGNAAGVAQHAVTAIPIVGPALDKASDQYADKNYAGEAGTLLGTAATVAPMVAGVVDRFGGIPRVPAAIDQGIAAFKAARNAPTTSLTPAEQSAVQITKAVNPPSAAWNNYLQAAHDQAGNVIDYAKRNNMPISDARDFAKAAAGAQKETLAHYQDNFLAPNADQTVPITDTGYQGRLTGAGRATLADIDNRVNAINTELSSNFRKPTAGQSASAGASDAELTAEKQSLTPILHQALADATGSTPNDIAALRVRGGQLKTLASETQGAANSLSSGAARIDAGAPALPTSNSGIIQHGINYLRGGPEKIAAGKLTDALSNSPIESTPLVKPLPPASAAITTPEAAQQEFLRSQQLTQSSQDLAVQRGAQAQSVRDLNTQAQKAVSMGQRGPDVWATVGKARIASHIQQFTNAGVSMQDLAHLGDTSAGKQMLVNASDLTPGSTAMKNLVQQIKASMVNK